MKNTKYVKTIKIVSTILMILILLSFANTVLGTYTDPKELKGTGTVQGVNTLGQKIIGIITTVGIVVSVIVLVILGIKYMVGSASEKAEYKKTMIPYLIGAILVFAASSIASIVMSVAQTVTA